MFVWFDFGWFVGCDFGFRVELCWLIVGFGLGLLGVDFCLWVYEFAGF